MTPHAILLKNVCNVTSVGYCLCGNALRQSHRSCENRSSECYPDILTTFYPTHLKLSGQLVTVTSTHPLVQQQ
jgi:hypothetical protein